MYTCFNNSISGYFAFVLHHLISLALSLLPCDNAQKKQNSFGMGEIYLELF